MEIYSEKVLTELTAGGNSDAEIATPTNEPIFSPRIAIATAAPDGIAVKTPINSEWNLHLQTKFIRKYLNNVHSYSYRSIISGVSTCS